MKRRILLLMCAMLAFASPLFAQIKVTGTVSDASDGAGIPYASVVVKGTTTGVAADADGKYAISVPNAKSVLVFSAVGYENQEVTVGGRAQINVALSTDAAALDEVMVVAYGTTTKASFTGAAGKVDGDKIEMIPNASPLNTLNGSTPGIRVLSSAGQPGSDAAITVRGIGSINGNTDPLIVVDGMIFSGNLSTFPSSDIESITVLKDAASTALYGARAANGVIMITTRQGKGEVPSINVKISHGFVTREQKDYKKMNVNQYMEANWRQFYNNKKVDGASEAEAAAYASAQVVPDLGYDATNFPWSGVAINEVVGLDGKMNPAAKFLYADDVDWISATEQVGHVQDYAISASGRTKYSNYFGSVGYLNNQGYVKNSGFRRLSARANVSFEKKWLKFGTNLSASTQDQYGNPSTNVGNNSNIFHVVLRISPVYPIHRHAIDGSYILDENGDKIYDYGEGYAYGDGTNKTVRRNHMTPSNPASYLENRVSHYTRNIINAKPYVEIKFLKDFKFSANGGIYISNYENHGVGPYIAERETNTTTASVTDTRTSTYAFNQLLTWNHAFGDHHVDALLGHETNQYTYNYLSAEKQNQIIPGSNYELDNYGLASAAPEGYKNEYNTEGFFGRVNYDYLSRYFLSASYRRDGSSKFHKDSRWGNFWSVGASWIISNEEFMKGIDFVDNLKFRASYGTVGSDDLGSYFPWMALYLKNDNEREAGYTRSMASTGNINLKWEVSNNWDAAIEWQMFDRRFTGSLEYFYRQTNNLLMEVTLPSSTGLSTYNANDGGLLNSGLEFQLGYDIIKTKKVVWNVGFNGSVLHNEITYLPIPAYTTDGNQRKVEEGHSVYEWYLYQWRGVDPATGMNYFEPGATYYKKDEKGNPTNEYIDTIDTDANIINIGGKYYTTDIAKAKEDYSGSSIPKLYGGITSDLRVGRFSFNVNSPMQT